VRFDDPDASCPVCSWRVPADSAVAADDIGVVIDPRTDEVKVLGSRLGLLHRCPAASLPRDAAGRYTRPVGGDPAPPV
jgi:hypothetical protein